jgi:hypothetical protein
MTRLQAGKANDVFWGDVSCSRFLVGVVIGKFRAGKLPAYVGGNDGTIVLQSVMGG